LNPRLWRMIFRKYCAKSAVKTATERIQPKLELILRETHCGFDEKPSLYQRQMGG
jgi:hypothetical protein